MDHEQRLDQLDRYFKRIQRTILNRQNQNTGLFPASTDHNEHGDYRDAWVRDNLYTIQAIWGLHLSFKKFNPHDARCNQLADSSVRLMRGLLQAMMRQTAKVERFKYTQHPMDALHAKYHTDTGTQVVDDDKWGHLQIDATSLFVLMLARMTQSGLSIVYSKDEVVFVQNLVWYIGRGYRTPDFGIWERGNKINNGQLEVNASSVGMVKAALQSICQVDLLGNGQGYVYVIADEIARCRTTLESLLPRESLSKEVDAACLSVIGYPAFAIEKQSLVEKTRERIIKKLAGPWGCKRFLLDGHQTVAEQHGRLHYEHDELKNFENIESEWPLFYTYLYLEAIFDGDTVRTDYYRKMLDGLRVEKDGDLLLPELYLVPEELVDAERKKPGSQNRLPNQNIPLVWAQSLYYLGRMLQEGLLEKSDVDPLDSHSRIGKRPKTSVQIAIIAETEKVKSLLTADNINSQTQKDIAPVLIFPTEELSSIFSMVGVDRNHGLTGRPMRRMRSLATAQGYFIEGRSCLFISGFQNRTSFYLASDNRLLRESLKTDISYVSRHWDQPGLPTVVLYVRESMLDAQDSQVLIDTLQEVQAGIFNAVSVQTGPIHTLLKNTQRMSIPTFHDYHLPFSSLAEGHPGSWLINQPQKNNYKKRDAFGEFTHRHNIEELNILLKNSDNIYEQMDLLTEMLEQKGMTYEPNIAPGVTIQILLEEIYQRASDLHLWDLIRYASGVMGKAWLALEDAVAEIVARQKQIVLGRGHSNDLVINKPEKNQQILQLINAGCGQDPREPVLIQEVLVYLYMLMRDQPDSFKGLLTLRPGHLIDLIISMISSEKGIPQDEAYECMLSLSPSDVLRRIKQVIVSYQQNPANAYANEFLKTKGQLNPVQKLIETEISTRELPDHLDNWHQWRKQVGVMPKLGENFYEGLWAVLRSSHGLVIGERFNMKNRIETAVVASAMTQGEQQFSLLVEYVFDRIVDSDYRQLNIEALWALIAFVKQNPGFKIDDYFLTEVIIAHAVRFCWLSIEGNHQDHFEYHKTAAWQNFYELSPQSIFEGITRSIRFLVTSGSQENHHY